MSIQMLPTCHGTQLCVTFINRCPLLKCALHLGDSSFIPFMTQPYHIQQKEYDLFIIVQGGFRKGMLF